MSEQKTLAIEEYFALCGCALIGHRAGLVQQLARGRRARFHVGQLELDPLELVDRLAELAALARVADGVVGRALRDSDGLRGGAQARALERAQRDRQALADLADHVLLGHAHVVEDRLPGRRGADPELVLELADAEARPVGLDDERGQAPRLAVGDGEGDVEVGDRRGWRSSSWCR